MKESSTRQDVGKKNDYLLKERYRMDWGTSRRCRIASGGIYMHFLEWPPTPIPSGASC